MHELRRRVRIAGHVLGIWAVVSWPLSFCLLRWCEGVGDWVEAQYTPWFLAPLVLAPAVLGVLGGLVILFVFVLRREDLWLYASGRDVPVWVPAEGTLAIFSGALLFLIGGCFVAMAHR